MKETILPSGLRLLGFESWLYSYQLSTLEKLFNFSGPQFLHLSNEDDNHAYLTVCCESGYITHKVLSTVSYRAVSYSIHWLHVPM